MNWLELSQAERDARYNNSAAVANSQQIMAALEASSLAFRQAHPQYLELACGPKERQRWDVFPASNKASPCLIHIHGGYWQMRSKNSFTCLAEGVAAHGWSAALLGYTLAPEHSLSEIVSEVRSGLDWFAENRAKLGIEGPLVLSGWSAGAHLAAMMLGHSSISAGLAVSGVYELGPLRQTYVNEKLKLKDDEIAMLSPLHITPIAKPMTIAYGTAELRALVEDSRKLDALRADAQIGGELISVSRADHFTILDEFRGPDGVLVQAALRLC
jgi:arylformamidase